MQNIFQEPSNSQNLKRDLTINSKFKEILKEEKSRDPQKKIDKESTETKSGYSKFVKMMKSSNTITNIPDKNSIPLNSLMKSLEKQQKKDQDKLNMVEKIMDKLNDFQKGYQKEKKSKEEDEGEENEIMEDEANKELGMKIVFSENQINLNQIQERVFWSKEKIKSVRDKFRQAKILIEEKTERDFTGIKKLIEQGDTEGVLNALLNQHFKAFYQLEFPKRGIIEYFLRQNRPLMLLEVLKDSYYQWNYNFVFEYISEQLFEKNNVIMSNDVELQNIVTYDLYNKNMCKLLAWLLGSYNFYDLLRILVNKHEEFIEEKTNYNNFQEDFDINDYIENEENYTESLILCLRNKFQKLAKALVSYRDEIKDIEIVECAIEQDNMDFLKFIWENQAISILSKNLNTALNKDNSKSLKGKNQFSVKRKSMFEMNFEESNNLIFNNGHLLFTLSYLIDSLCKIKSKKNNNIHEIISTWDYIEYDQDILKTLFENECFDDISTLIRRYPNNWNFDRHHLQTAIVKKQLDLIVFFLKIPECQDVLNESIIQEFIVNKYIKGNKIYYGAEMLSYILKNNWKKSLTEELIKKIKKTIKTKSILECHSPLLTCLLLSEFISQIGENSINYKIICENTVYQLCEFSRSIQEANPDERYVKFLMTQKDTKGRSVFQIAADNNYYSVLKTPEVGTIVQKMWNGRLTNEGLFSFSSLSRYLDSSSSKSFNPYLNFETMNPNKTYFHQLNLWMESSSQRYWPESVSNILLILIYNLFIYFLIYEDKKDINDGLKVTAMMKPWSQLDPTIQIMMFIYIGWVVSIVLNIPLQIIFCKLSKRKYRLDGWGIIEICTLISACMLLIDTRQIFTVKDEEGNKIPQDISTPTSNAFILRALILSVNDIFVWLRITGILLTFKNIGPLIRMIYFLSLIIAKYLVIYSFFLTGCTAIFVSIFYNVSDQFNQFSKTFAALFAGFLSNFDIFNFDSYKMFGAVMILVYVTFSGYMLTTLLIAMISNLYVELRLQADALHRIVLISYYRRYKWDREHGYLIFLTTPLNIINYLALLISFLFKDKERFNTIICRVYYIVFYFPYIFLIQLIYSTILIPICYIKGIFMMLYYELHTKSNIFNKLINWLNWFLFGIFFIILMYLRDIVLIFLTLFKKIHFVSFEKSRIQRHISKEDIRIFLQYIHTRPENEPCDLHNLFLNYIEYDQNEKAEQDMELKEKKNYLQKIQSAGHNTERPNIKNPSSIFLFKNQTFKKNQTKRRNENKPKTDSFNEGSSSMSNFLRRNLIIIEILENFLIDDGSDNFIVDIKKLKLLLPKTMNIDNNYLKRIINTDINSISRAIKKLKNKKKKQTDQNPLLNKLVGAVIRLDSFVDGEIKDPLGSKKDRKRLKYEVEENEDEFYNQLLSILEEISKNVKSSIKTTEIKINQNQKKKKEFKTIKDNRRNIEN